MFVVKESDGCFETEAVEDISGFHYLCVALAQNVTSNTVAELR